MKGRRECGKWGREERGTNKRSVGRKGEKKEGLWSVVCWSHNTYRYTIGIRDLRSEVRSRILNPMYFNCKHILMSYRTVLTTRHIRSSLLSGSQFPDLIPSYPPKGSDALARAMMEATRKTLSHMFEFEGLPDLVWQQALFPIGPGLGLTNLVIMVPYIWHTQVFLRLAGMDFVLFGGFCDAGKWDSLKGTTIHWCFTRALNASQKAFGEDMKIAQQQNFFCDSCFTSQSVQCLLEVRICTKQCQGDCTLSQSTLYSCT